MKRVISFAALASVAAAPAQAAYVINFEELGGDVVASGQGRLDYSALTFQNSGTPGALDVQSAAGQAGVGSGFQSTYAGASFPSGFNITNDLTPVMPNITTGNVVGVSGGLLVLPTLYVSGTDLGHSTAGFYGTTFAGLNLKQGSYTWSWGSGPNADSLTINIGVPEPSTWAMMILGFALVGGILRRRKQGGESSCRLA